MIDPVSAATSYAIQRSRNQGLSEVDPDALLLGCLTALSRFGIARIGPLTIDLEALGIDWQQNPGTSTTPKIAYSEATVAIFDRASRIARIDGCAAIRIEHLLVAFASEKNGLMETIRKTCSIDGAAWRAAVADLSTANPAGFPQQRDAASASTSAGHGSGREYLTPEEAAEALGVHVQTLRAYIRSGKLPALRLAGERSLRIRHSDLEKVLEPLVSDVVPDASPSEKEK